MTLAASCVLLCPPSPPRQSYHPWLRDAGSLRRAQHLPDSPERDAQLPGQNLEWENERSKRAADQQQLGKVTASENGRVPEQRWQNGKD